MISIFWNANCKEMEVLKNGYNDEGAIKILQSAYIIKNVGSIEHISSHLYVNSKSFWKYSLLHLYKYHYNMLLKLVKDSTKDKKKIIKEIHSYNYRSDEDKKTEMKRYESIKELMDRMYKIINKRARKFIKECEEEMEQVIGEIEQMQKESIKLPSNKCHSTIGGGLSKNEINQSLKKYSKFLDEQWNSIFELENDLKKF